MNIGEAGLGIYTPAPALTYRRVEKPNPPSELSDGDKRMARSHMVIAATPAVAEVSRGGTPAYDQSPIFGRSCGFMAQMIAQVLAARAVDSGYASRAYSVNRPLAGAAAPHLVDTV